MKKWKCTVCGYIHEGEEPPDECPVCGAPKEKFELVVEEDQAPEAPAKAEDQPVEESAKPEWADEAPSGPGAWYKSLWAKTQDMMIKFHAHPIAVHTPNGVIPIAFVMCLLAAGLQMDGMSKAAFFNLIFVALSMPVVLYSGFLEWQRRYGGNMTTLFATKLVCGGIVTLCAFVLVGWLILYPKVLLDGEGGRGAFLLVHMAMLGAAGVAGHMGSKLVFKEG